MLQVQNHAEICPVCRGSGKYKETYNMNYTNATYIEKTCHGCQGKGWVIVPEAQEIKWSTSSTTGESQHFDIEEAIEKHVPNIM